MTRMWAADGARMSCSAKRGSSLFPLDWHDFWCILNDWCRPQSWRCPTEFSLGDLTIKESSIERTNKSLWIPECWLECKLPLKTKSLARIGCSGLYHRLTSCNLSREPSTNAEKMAYLTPAQGWKSTKLRKVWPWGSKAWGSPRAKSVCPMWLEWLVAMVCSEIGLRGNHETQEPHASINWVLPLGLDGTGKRKTFQDRKILDSIRLIRWVSVSDSVSGNQICEMDPVITFSGGGSNKSYVGLQALLLQLPWAWDPALLKWGDP